VPFLADVLHDDAAELRSIERAPDLANRCRLCEAHLDQRPAGEVDPVVETAPKEERDHADQDEERREQDHPRGQPDEVDVRVGRDELEEPGRAGGRRLLLRAPIPRTRRLLFLRALHTLTVPARRVASSQS
jgi:hypothetical protein